MLEYTGDSFDYIPPSGEMVVLLLAAAIWLSYVLPEAKRTGSGSLQRILWFTFWMAQLSKSVRSPRLVLLGNGIIGLVGLLVLAESLRRRTPGSDLLVRYLLASVLLYTSVTLLWYHDARNLRVFFTGAVLWWAVLLYFQRHDHRVFLDHVFAGFDHLIVYTALLVLAFQLGFPGDGTGEMGIAGPFRPNSLARNAFVLLVGLFYRHFILQDLRRGPFYLLCVINLVLSTLTLSRSGMALSYLFLLGNLRALGRPQRHAVILLSCAALAVVLLSKDFTARFERRFLETDDRGRLDGIKAVIGEGTRELLWGHGFMRSSVEDFQSSHHIDRERGYSSHCYFASVFYEFGIAGSCIYAALAAVVLCRLYRLSRLYTSYRFALASFLCFAISGLFENTSLWPITAEGALASLMVVLASEAARPCEPSRADLYRPQEAPIWEPAGMTEYPTARL